jgi:hypothetical protein
VPNQRLENLVPLENALMRRRYRAAEVQASGVLVSNSHQHEEEQPRRLLQMMWTALPIQLALAS